MGEGRGILALGDALAAHIDAHEGSTYGRQVIRNLCKDLQLGYTTLYGTLRFRRVVADPIVYARTQLGWSHFRALIHLPPDQLEHYARLAADNAWTTRQLKQAIETGGGAVLSAEVAPASPLRPSFGEPATYRVVADRLPTSSAAAIDFGFHQVWVPAGLPGFAAARPGDRVTLEVTADGARARIRTDRPRLYTYAASVLRVVDGDTLDVGIDLGLGHRAFPRLRLRGLDTPELYTQVGRDARAFVEQALADTLTVIVSTWRTDTYGRYLADVNYLPGSDDPARILAEGTYLNGQLLRAKLAVRYLG